MERYSALSRSECAVALDLFTMSNSAPIVWNISGTIKGNETRGAAEPRRRDACRPARLRVT